MAYRRSSYRSRRGSYSRGSSRSYSRGSSRRRAPARRRSSSSARTVRIVIEQPNASLARDLVGLTTRPAARKAKF